MKLILASFFGGGLGLLIVALICEQTGYTGALMGVALAIGIVAGGGVIGSLLRKEKPHVSNGDIVTDEQYWRGE